ncbi:DUF3078 domain-containing protein [Mucilaginibacter aquatilis]|nr:DUF3078 domain-containing protein [Mucilaginibacter aquatilis]
MLRTALTFISAFVFMCATVFAQQTDSLRRADSLQRVALNLQRTTDSLRRADSLRRDSIKIDTNLINRYRISPRRNAVPRQLRPIIVTPEYMPVSMMDYKISYWHKTAIIGINFNQSSFSNNWTGGGVNSFAINGNIDYKLEYNKQPFVFTTQLVLLYGRSKNKEQLPRKTNDRIFWDNKLATQLSKSWFFFGSLSFESQFDKGFRYDANKPPVLISQFMAPGYITESFGFEYKPNNWFDLRIGTGTARQTFVLNDGIEYSGNPPKAYNVQLGRSVYNELAFQAVALFDKEVMQNLRLTSRYQIFVPYGRGAQNIDHRLDLTIAAKVNRLVAVTITGVAIYDRDAFVNRTDTQPGIQASENLALGIIYRFP